MAGDILVVDSGDEGETGPEYVEQLFELLRAESPGPRVCVLQPGGLSDCVAFSLRSHVLQELDDLLGDNAMYCVSDADWPAATPLVELLQQAFGRSVFRCDASGAFFSESGPLGPIYPPTSLDIQQDPFIHLQLNWLASRLQAAPQRRRPALRRARRLHRKLLDVVRDGFQAVPDLQWELLALQAPLLLLEDRPGLVSERQWGDQTAIPVFPDLETIGWFLEDMNAAGRPATGLYTLDLIRSAVEQQATLALCTYPERDCPEYVLVDPEQLLAEVAPLGPGGE